MVPQIARQSAQMFYHSLVQTVVFHACNLESSVERALGNPFFALFSRVLVWSAMSDAFEKSANVATVSLTSLHNLIDVISVVQ